MNLSRPKERGHPYGRICFYGAGGLRLRHHLHPRPLTCGNGFLLQFLNVKILMLGIAFYSGYILPYGFHPGRIVAFALLLVWCAWKIVKT